MRDKELAPAMRMAAIDRILDRGMGKPVQPTAADLTPVLEAPRTGDDAKDVTERPHIPVWGMSKREEGILSRADFTFDRQRDLYICPHGKFLSATCMRTHGMRRAP